VIKLGGVVLPDVLSIRGLILFGGVGRLICDGTGVESPAASAEISVRLNSWDCRALVGVTGSIASLLVSSSSSSSGMGSWWSIDRVSGELEIDASCTSSNGGVGGGSKGTGWVNNDIFALTRFQFTDSNDPAEDAERGGVFM
jgi:hypothetical protein